MIRGEFMSYSQQIYKKADEKMNERRNNALREADKRKEELYAKNPRLSEIDAELSQVWVETAKAILSENGDTKAVINSLKEKSLALQHEYNKILNDMGFDSDYLDVHYSCEKCKDTGKYEVNSKTVLCECYKKLLSDCVCEQLNSISPLTLSTFDTFNLSFYDDVTDTNGKNPYQTMVKIFDFCENYANNFTINSKSILMKGNTGLGKTHLSLAIANKVIEKGYSVVYVSAPDILSKLEREHFSGDYSDENDTFRSLIGCDLLIIDDLGTEFSTQFTKAAIYNIFNSRVLQNKPIIMNTNLSVNELVEMYSSRFYSRVIGSCFRLDFIGRDIRTKL